MVPLTVQGTTLVLHTSPQNAQNPNTSPGGFWLDFSVRNTRNPEIVDLSESVRQTRKEEEEEEGGREGGDYSEKLGVRCVLSKLCQHDVHGLGRLTP